MQTTAKYHYIVNINMNMLTTAEQQGYNILQKLREPTPIDFYHERLHDKHSAGKFLTEISQIAPNKILIILDYTDEIIQKILDDNAEDCACFFFRHELRISPITSCMVPRHRIATNTEIHMLQNKYGISKRYMLPILKFTDPVRRWHNFERGKIIAIERTEKETYFRVVY